MAIKHAFQTALPDDPTKDVSASEWNANLVIEDNTITDAHVATHTSTKVTITRARPDPQQEEDLSYQMKILARSAPMLKSNPQSVIP